MSDISDASSQGVIIPPRPKQDYLEVMGFIEGAEKVFSFKGRISLKEIKQFELKEAGKIEIKVTGFSSFRNSVSEEY